MQKRQPQPLSKPSKAKLGLLQSLRASTHSEHRALEAQPLLRALLTPELTLAQYGRLLQGLFCFYRSLETLLIPAARAATEQFPAGEYDYLARSEWLRQDLLSLSLESIDGPTPELPADFGLEGTIGVLYVLEGATQGGRVIAPQVEGSLGVTQAAGASFFNAHRRSSSWTLFQRWVSDFEDSYLEKADFDHTVAIHNACTTFSGLHTHLNLWQSEFE